MEREEGWELAAPVSLGVLVLRYAPAALSAEAQDRINHDILERVNRGGEAFLTHTVLGGRVAIRLAVGNLRTSEAHAARAWELLRAAARAARGAPAEAPTLP